VSGNSSKFNGGGIAQFGTGTLHLRNATIAGNTADSDSGAPGDFVGNGGGVSITSGTATVRNSIIADNTDGSSAPNDHDDCSGSLTSEGYNLIESITGCTFTNVDDTVADPLLGMLSDNGGLTSTHALFNGSPAINNANPGMPGSGGVACEATDQRGQPRGGAAGGCDIGAFERQPPVLGPVGNKTVQVGQTLTFGLTATDPDPADLFVFSGTNLPAGATVNAMSGEFSWTPSAEQLGSHANVNLAAGDGTFTDNETITITVTAIPVPAPPGGGISPTTTAPQATGQRAAALKKCKKKRGKARSKCKKRAKKLPV
jgi:hypothetical protein